MNKKWIVKQYIHDPRTEGVMGEDWDIDEFEYEIAVVREDNELGQESFGWGGFNKLILFDSDSADELLGPLYSEDDAAVNKHIDAKIEWMTKIAEITANALNKEGV